VRLTRLPNTLRVAVIVAGRSGIDFRTPSHSFLSHSNHSIGTGVPFSVSFPVANKEAGGRRPGTMLWPAMGSDRNWGDARLSSFPFLFTVVATGVLLHVESGRLICSVKDIFSDQMKII